MAPPVLPRGVGPCERERLRPRPRLHLGEEALEQPRWRGGRVATRDGGEEDVPVDAAEVPHLVRVDPAALRPQAHAAQHGQEAAHVGHKAHDGPSDARPVEAARRRRVEPREQRIVHDVQRGRQLRHRHAGKQQVDVRRVAGDCHVERHDRRVRRLNGHQLGDSGGTLQLSAQAAKEVGERGDSRRNHKRVDVGATLTEPEAVRARRKK